GGGVDPAQLHQELRHVLVKAFVRCFFQDLLQCHVDRFIPTLLSRPCYPDTALAINEKCFEKGLLMFAPVGIAHECIKIAPPLITTKDALEEGLSVLDEVCDEVLEGWGGPISVKSG
ncbi:unnamed protein product, partial [marine sediment metagenome]